MGIYEHTRYFAGTSIADWEPETAIEPLGIAQRIATSYDDDDGAWFDQFDAFINGPDAAETTTLIVGMWDQGDGDDSAAVVEAIVAARDRLPALRAIFLGDIVSEEQEMSWINQADPSLLFEAFPDLEHFCIRGGTIQGLGPISHARLRSLVVQSGGLPSRVVTDVAASQLPALEHLELWLGTPDYGGDTTIEDLAPILAGGLFPRLRYLGLRDSAIADEVAAALATSPLLEQIRMLDLSLGTLTDAGAAALLASPALAELEFLDLHHHYLSTGMVEKIAALGIKVDVSDVQSDDKDGDEVYRYVAVGE